MGSVDNWLVFSRPKCGHNVQYAARLRAIAGRPGMLLSTLNTQCIHGNGNGQIDVSHRLRYATAVQK